IPARVVRDRAGIPERVAVLAQRPLASALPQRPQLLEPGHVADLPVQWIDDGEPGALQLFRREVGHEAEAALAGIPDPLRELSRVGHEGIGPILADAIARRAVRVREAAGRSAGPQPPKPLAGLA